MLYGALVSHIHNLDSSCILWREFDRAELEKDNYIDANVLVHRASLVAKYGAWDTRLSCLNDWDIALRYSADKPARAERARGLLSQVRRHPGDRRRRTAGGARNHPGETFGTKGERGSRRFMTGRPAPAGSPPASGMRAPCATGLARRRRECRAFPRRSFRRKSACSRPG